VIIVVTFLRIAIKMRSSVLQTESIRNSRERNITKLTFRSCATYNICFLPFFICNLLVRFGGFYSAEINTARVLTVTIAKFTYVLNPFLHEKMLKVQRPANNIFPNGCPSQRFKNASRCQPSSAQCERCYCQCRCDLNSKLKQG